MDKTSLVAVDKKYGPVVNLENVIKVTLVSDVDGITAVALRYVDGWWEEYAGTDARRIVNALNARSELELGA